MNQSDHGIPESIRSELGSSVANVIEMSCLLFDVHRNVVVLRSDIPKVNLTFHGHSYVYRVGRC